MDYAAKLEEIHALISGEHYQQAVIAAGQTLELLYKELYRQLLGHIPLEEREELTSIEKKLGKGKSLDGFSLGQTIGLFREGKVVQKLGRQLKLSLDFTKQYSPNYLLALRNRTTHGDDPVNQVEASLCFWQLYTVLQETDRPVPDRIVAPRRAAPISSTPERPPWFSSDDWARYAASLSEALELETRTYRVPVDLLQNKVVELGEPRPGTGERRSISWLEAAPSVKPGLAVLLGYPGEGKTVSFANLARWLLDDLQENPHSPIPIRIRLSFYDPPDHSLAALLAGQMRQHGLDVTCADEVPAVLRQRPWCVLLDGLNEVPDHMPLLTEVSGLMADARDSHYFLSCRQADYHLFKELIPAHTAWDLQGFERDDIENFLMNSPHVDSDQRETLEVWLKDGQLVEVLRTPFFLSLLPDLAQSDAPAPRSRAEVCQYFVAEYQNREKRQHTARRLAGEPWPLLEAVAYRLLELQETRLSLSGFEVVCRHTWVEQFYGQETTLSLDDTLHSLYSSPFLLLERGAVSFTHQLFRDFFGARALTKRAEITDPQAFSHYVGDRAWDDVIVLLSGLLPDASPIIHNIIYEGSRPDLAARCLGESKRLHAQVVQDLTRWFRQQRAFDELLRIGPLIAQLPVEARAWAVSEIEAILRAVLASNLEWWRYFAFSWHSFAESGWPASAELHRRIASDVLRSGNASERCNAVIALGMDAPRDAGHPGSLLTYLTDDLWDAVQHCATDPDPRVCERLAQAMRFFVLEVSDKSLTAVETLAQNSQVQVRSLAMSIAAGLASKRSAVVLEQGLSDGDANVVLAALDAIMVADGNVFAELRARVPELLPEWAIDALYEAVFPEELEEDPGDRLLEALMEINTCQASEIVYVAAVTGCADGIQVAELFADRYDPRAIFALVGEMCERPKYYLSDEDRLERVHKQVEALMQAPFEMAWLEAILIEQEVFEELQIPLGSQSSSGRLRRMGPHAALANMVERAESNRSALLSLLGVLLAARYHGWRLKRLCPILEGAIYRLVQVDPSALSDDALWGWEQPASDDVRNGILEWAGRFKRCAFTMEAERDAADG